MSSTTSSTSGFTRPPLMSIPDMSPPALATLFYGTQERHQLIAETAYFRALHRGFAPGHELDDWLAAEAQVDADLIIGLPQ